MSGDHRITNLLSINDDCKLKIFENMGYRDLINIAETSKELHSAAAAAFKRKFAKGKLIICCLYEDPWSRPCKFITRYEDKAPNMCPDTRILILKILRNFGHLVTDIFLKYHEYVRDSLGYHIENYMAEYCSKTLTNLQLIERPKLLFDRLVQFVNLKRFDMCESRSLKVVAVPFRECFPNLHSLIWNPVNNDVLPPINITIGIPSLRHLSILIVTCMLQCRCKEILQLLRLNPQLTMLELRYTHDKCDITILPRVRDYLPKLEVLSLKSYPYRPTDEIVHFENVVNLSMHLNDMNGDFKIIPFTFSKLGSLSVDHYHSVTQSAVVDFIATNEHLKKLHVKNIYGVVNVTKMLPVLSNRVEDLTIVYDYMPSSEVVLRLLSEIQSLKKLVLVARYKRLDFAFNHLVQSKIVSQRTCKNSLYVTFYP